MVSGQVAYQFAGPITVLGLARAGRLRLLAVTSPRRAAALPDLPTVAESGVPSFEVTNWFGMTAPPATPAPLILRLSTEMKHLLHLENVATASIRASLNDELNKLGAFLIRDTLTGHNGCFGLRLLSQEKQTKTKREETCEGVLKVFFCLLHERLQDAL